MRRNLWQHTEDLASITYTADGSTKQADSILVNGMTLTRWSGSGFYSDLRSNIVGLGLAPFTAGERYLVSYFAKSAGSAEQFVMARDMSNAVQQGHGQKLLVPGAMRRIWSVVGATSASNTDNGKAAGTALGAGVGSQQLYWIQQCATEGGSVEAYLGGFMIEKLADATYKDGIAMIGDSTMAGGSGFFDWMNVGSREVSVWLGAMLNVPVFNRAQGGERTDQMDARWATDITPLAVNCKYAVIQGGINDLVQDRPLADIKASIGSMVAKAQGDGLLPVLFTCTPTDRIGTSATREASRQALNAWLVATYPCVIDIASVVADPLNPAALRPDAGWIGDGTHYASEAKRAAGMYASQWSGWDFIAPSAYQAILGTTFTG